MHLREYAGQTVHQHLCSAVAAQTPGISPMASDNRVNSAYWVLKGFKVQLDHSVLSELLDPSKAQAIPNIWQESVREALAWYSKKSENAQKLHQFQPRVCLVKYVLFI